MHSRKVVSIVAVFLLISLPAISANQSNGSAVFDSGLERLVVKVGDVDREAHVYVPASASSKSIRTPVIFVFHGHGGTARQAARSFTIHRYWPEAITVYMQGLKTSGRLIDAEGKLPGWQVSIGDQDDRDLKFYDAMLERLRKDYRVDDKRIYATGHSNGGSFTYLLWAARGESLAAVAPSGAVAGVRTLGRMRPKPAMVVAGENDRLVKFEWQEATMNAVNKLNGCAAAGKPWEEQCTVYESRNNTPLVQFIHQDGHRLPETAPKLIVKFFMEHPETIP